METVPLLKDIDDEKHYAQLLEVAYAEALTELAEILTHADEYSTVELHLNFLERNVLQTSRDLHRLRVVMALTVRQSVGRRRRLADVARRLADVVLDKEGAEK